jgi:hypothetical protein
METGKYARKNPFHSRNQRSGGHDVGFQCIRSHRNTCWHTHEAYEFPHEAGVVVHEDNWRWGPHEKFVFREHEGRGYWRGSKWAAW